MSSHLVRTESINAIAVELYVDSHGKFFAEPNGQLVTADTIQALIHAVKRKLDIAKLDLSIEATIVQLEPSQYARQRARRLGLLCRDITLTGIHLSNGSVLARYVDSGECFQVNRWSSEDCFVTHRLTTAERKFITLTREELNTATAAYESVVERFAIANVGEFMKGKINAAITARADAPASGDPRIDPPPPRRRTRKSRV